MSRCDQQQMMILNQVEFVVPAEIARAVVPVSMRSVVFVISL
jgi:hypothetical protein